MKILENNKYYNPNNDDYFGFNEKASIDSNEIQHSERSHNLKTVLYNKQLNKIDMEIILDNILIFGYNFRLNDRIASMIQKIFDDNGKDSKLLSSDDFLCLPKRERRKDDIFYIITYDARSIFLPELVELKCYTSNRVLFKLPGIKWNQDSSKVSIDYESRKILSALGIDQNNIINIFMIALLQPKEFCIMTP